ncbi:nicotinate-nucleotide adenylyltransferase, partial [Nanoarchaeota archaeon]
SCNKSGKDNPFSGDEREEMLRAVLEANDIVAKIVQVPDIPSDEKYVGHVEEYVGKPDKVITENPLTEKLYKEAGYKVEITERYFGISATEIREKMIVGGEWQKLVPAQVVEYLEKIGGVERVKSF